MHSSAALGGSCPALLVVSKRYITPPRQGVGRSLLALRGDFGDMLVNLCIERVKLHISLVIRSSIRWLARFVPGRDAAQKARKCKPSLTSDERAFSCAHCGVGG